MARPTHEFRTSDGRVIVINDFITGEEHRSIRRIYIEGLEQKRSTADIDFDADNRMFEVAVVSVDGITEAIVGSILALPLADFRALVDDVKALLDEDKKKSQVS